MTVRKTATENGIIIFKDQLNLFKLMPDEVLGQGIKLLLENFEDLPEIDNIAYEVIASNVRRYREQAVVSSKMASRRWNTDNEPTTDPLGRDKLPNATIQYKNIKESIKKKGRKKILLPTLKDIQDYSRAKGREDIAQKFYDYYAPYFEDKDGKPIKNWKNKFNVWCMHEPKVEEESGSGLFDDIVKKQNERFGVS